MATIIIRDAQDAEHRIEANPSVSLLNMMLRAGIAHPHRCGGKAECGTCKVLVVEGAEHLSRPLPRELERLRVMGAGKNERLACQTFAIGNCIIKI